tara:strand:- start:71 stop:316 length:246 start_codon:yes stop_codon:yes gene_type:complete
MGNFNSIISKSNNIIKQGRWILKNNKQIEINQYWSNIDHCGDKVCGNLQETNKFYKNQIINNNYNVNNFNKKNKTDKNDNI